MTDTIALTVPRVAATKTASKKTTEVWSECLAAWLAGLRSDNTRRAYRRAIDEFTSGGCSLEQTTKNEVGTWISTMKAQGLADATIRLKVSALSAFFEYARSDYTTFNAGQEIPLLERENPAAASSKRIKVSLYGKGRYLTAEETRRFLMQIQPAGVVGKRDFALMLGYIILGRRNTEWRLARVCDFEQLDGKIFYRWSGKGRQDERLEVSEQAWKALHEYIHVSGGRGIYDYVFLDRDGTKPLSERRVGQIVKRYARKAGIAGRLRVHDLRHTAAMLRRRAGADVEEIRQFLGHSSLTTTAVYLHRMERKSDQRSAQVEELLKF